LRASFVNRLISEASNIEIHAIAREEPLGGGISFQPWLLMGHVRHIA
jgi:hypothetical protein